MPHALVRISIFGLGVILGGGPVAEARGQTTALPECTGWSDCSPGRGVCTSESGPIFYGATIISDRADGLSSDGRGPYRSDTDGVTRSWVPGPMSLGVNGPTGSATPRSFSVNLGSPVAGGAGVPLGVVTVRGDNLLYVSWQRRGNVLRSLANLPVGDIVQVEQLNVSFHLDGRFHVLQFGPRPLGACHEASDTRVDGSGTTAGTVHRASTTRWVVDLPPGSVGRLFDASHTMRHAVDKGLYRFSLHYELADAVPGAGVVLRPLAEAQGGAAVVARYQLMKRDSATAYFFSEMDLWSAGFALLDNKRPTEALLVFRLSAEEYPESAYAVGGLGESFLAVGDTVQAVRNLRRAVALQPDHQRSLVALRRLGVAP